MRIRCEFPALFLLVVAGCAPPPFDAAATAAALLQRDAAWAAVAGAGQDIDSIVSFWSDTAVVIPQGQPEIQGKAALRAFVTSSFQIPGFKIRWVSQQVAFSPDGKLAYMRSTNETTVPGPNGATMVIPGRAVTIWRLESDGIWRCVLDTWNDPPAAAGRP